MFLKNLDLSDLIADSPEKYVQIALDLAGDRPRLRELRPKECGRECSLHRFWMAKASPAMSNRLIAGCGWNW